MVNRDCIRRALVLMLLPWNAHASPSPGATAAVVPSPPVDFCRATVLKFEQALVIMRQTQGNKAGMELKEKLLPAKVESEILLKEGYCGLARYIQHKRLDR